MNIIEVILWDKLVGVLVWDDNKQSAAFEYTKSFIKQGLEISPLLFPLSSKVVKAEQNNFKFDKGLPLFLSDSLPDKFGTVLFSKYLEKEGKNYNDLLPTEKLSYIGNRGMGALEYLPSKSNIQENNKLNLKKLNELSKSLINNQPISNINAMGNLFHVGTSPGGAQPKVLINIDRITGDIFRGDQIPTEDQDSWILKFNRDTGSDSDHERGKIEYAYYLMAKNASINIMHSELKEIDNEFYFMTKRFDRYQNEKIHTQTLHALAGMHFMQPNTYSYEQIFTIFNTLKLNYKDKEQLFRLMLFNIMARNVDDHTKNFGFNMTKNGQWNFSPAYDLTFSYNTNYNRETPHFLSVNGKNLDITIEDILTKAKEHNIKSPKKIINDINKSILNWAVIAEELKISESTITYITSKLKTFDYYLKES